MTAESKRLGILVGGGPAPGINSAISATTIEANNSGLEVIAIYDGYEHLMEGRIDQVRPLDISEVSRIHFQGGSILRTSRANPTNDRRKAGLEDLLNREMGQCKLGDGSSSGHSVRGNNGTDDSYVQFLQ